MLLRQTKSRNASGTQRRLDTLNNDGRCRRRRGRGRWRSGLGRMTGVGQGTVQPVRCRERGVLRCGCRQHCVWGETVGHAHWPVATCVNSISRRSVSNQATWLLK